MSSSACPCGSGQTYSACCEPYLDGHPAPTAEALMRSRYTAFTKGNVDHLVRSWHPRTRPKNLTVEPTNWTGLRIVSTTDGGPQDDHGVVEFIASWREPDGGVASMHEVSRFARRGGRWVYVDGDVS